MLDAGRDVAVSIRSAPSSVNRERVAALRTAFNATMTDPDFLAEAKKGKIVISAMTGEEAEAKVKAILATPKAILDTS